MATISSEVEAQRLAPASPTYAFRREDTLSGTAINVPRQRGQQLSDQTRVILLYEPAKPTRPARTRTGDGAYPWESLLTRIEELISLPSDWDAHGGVAVQPWAVVQALTLLDEVLPEDLFAPSLIPTHEGALALEWHTPTQSLEIEVGAAGAGSVYFRNRTTGMEWERDLHEVRPRLGQILQELAAGG
jgi:hypothetical protein